MALRFASNSVARFSSVVSVDWDNVSNKPAGLPLAVGLSEILNGTTGGLLYNNNGVLGNYPPTVFGYREMLTGTRIYYVASTGSNVSNTGRSLGSPFLTIQHAIDTILQTIDAQGFSVFVLVADGAYTTPTKIASFTPDLNLVIQIVGNAGAPSNCTITTTGAHCFEVTQGAKVLISGFKLSTLGSGDCIAVDNQSICNFGNINFGAAADHHLTINNYSIVSVIGNITISGSSFAFIHQPTPSIFLASTFTFTLTGTPTFTNYFIGMRGNSFAQWTGASFVGTAFGSRFTSHFGAVLDCEGKSLTFLPGHVAGDISGGGIYIGDKNYYSNDLNNGGVNLTVAGYGINYSGSTGAQVWGANSITAVAANGTVNLTLFSGLVVWSDITNGGSALVLYDAGTATVGIVAQTGSNFVTVDPGAGASKWWVKPSGVVQNRYAGAASIDYALVSSRAGILI